MKINRFTLFRDTLGGFTSVMVALPAALAFGISIYSSLGHSFAAMAALSGILGTIAIGLTAPLLGGTPRLISAPCAPAAAVLGVFVSELVFSLQVEPALVPILLSATILVAGVFQIFIGILGGGRLIKYIPYPVIAGYLSGLGVLIFFSQIPKLLGVQKIQNLTSISNVSVPSVVVGTVTAVSMGFALKFSKRIPPALVGLGLGILSYFVLGFVDRSLWQLQGNSLLVGRILPEDSSVVHAIFDKWTHFENLANLPWNSIWIPALTLGFLLSVDTLKTCLVIDALTLSRHNSNRELLGQGVGNVCSSIFGGIAGAGTLGPTLVNLSTGARTRASGFFSGIFALIVLFFFTRYLQWLPIPTLAGVLLVLGFRMVDWKSFGLLRNQSTVLDFFVILIVVLSALGSSLIIAAGVGIFMAILLFLREQVKSAVVRRKFLGSHKFSKKKRLPSEYAILEEHGNKTAFFELQGQLFFGTTDQLFNTLEDYISSCEFIILDFRRVMSIDFTAVNMLKQIHSRIRKKGGSLVLASIPEKLSTGHNVHEYLSSLGLSDKTPHLYFFEDYDEALEWTEDQWIERFQVEAPDWNVSLNLHQFEIFENFPVLVVRKLRKLMVQKNFSKGSIVFKQGETNDCMYFICKGTVKIELPLGPNTFHHLATFGRGDFFGDMAFLDHETRSANANATEDTELLELSRKSFDNFAKKDSEAAALFFQHLALTISKRLRLNLVELGALQES